MLNKLLAIIIFGLIFFTYISPAKAELTVLNTEFGTGGISVVTLNEEGDFYVAGMTLLDDGSIILIGSQYNGVDDCMAMWKVTSGGVIDTSFGENGRYEFPGSGYSSGQAVIQLSNGKIVIAGQIENDNGDYDMAIWMFTESGELDLSFNDGSGFQTYGEVFDDGSSDLVEGGDGSIYVTGYLSDEGDDYYTTSLVVLKYLNSGELDLTFGTDGVILETVNIEQGTYTILTDKIFLTANDTIIIAGRINSQEYNNDAFWQYTTAGLPVENFGVDGVAAIPLDNYYSHNSFLNTDGSLISIGYSESYDEHYIVTKVLTSGVLDTSFGENGVIEIKLSEKLDISNFEMWKLYIEDSRKIFITGNLYDENQSTNNSLVCMSNIDGTLDIKFADDGCLIYEEHQHDYEFIESDDNGVITMVSNTNFLTNNILQLNTLYQVDFGSNIGGYTASVNGTDIGVESLNGVRGQQTVLISKGNNPLAEILVNFDEEASWSELVGNVDLANFRSFLHNANTIDNIASTYSLYIPFRTGDNSVTICPGAPNFEALTATCVNAQVLTLNSPNVTQETINGQRYWKVGGLTGTGGFSTASAAAATPGLTNTGANILFQLVFSLILLGAVVGARLKKNLVK